MNSKSKELGNIAEKTAAEYLEKQGLKIKELNHRNKIGEIDIIAQDGDIYVFVEVKAKTSNRLGGPADMVGYKKQEKLKKLARYYFFQNELEELDYRIDVVALDFSVTPPKISWIKSAVEELN